MGKKNRGPSKILILCFFALLIVILGLAWAVYTLLTPKVGSPTEEDIEKARNMLYISAGISGLLFGINMPGFKWIFPLLIFFTVISLLTCAITLYLAIKLTGDDPDIDTVVKITKYVSITLTVLLGLGILRFLYEIFVKDKNNDKKDKKEKAEDSGMNDMSSNDKDDSDDDD